LSEYDEYPLSIKRHKSEAEDEQADVQEEDINQKISFPSYSEEVGEYFQGLLDESQHPEERYKRKKR